MCKNLLALEEEFEQNTILAYFLAVIKILIKINLSLNHVVVLEILDMCFFNGYRFSCQFDFILPYTEKHKANSNYFFQFCGKNNQIFKYSQRHFTMLQTYLITQLYIIPKLHLKNSYLLLYLFKFNSRTISGQFYTIMTI